MASATTQLYENAAAGSPGRGHGGADEEKGTIELDAAEAQDTEAHGSLRGSARSSPLGSPLPARDSPAASENPTASAGHNAMSFRSSPGRSRSPARGREPMYVTKWCSGHAGVGFQFNDSKNLVTYAGVRGLHLYVPRIFFCSLVLGCVSMRVRFLCRSAAGPQGLQSSNSDSKCRAVVCRDHAEMCAKHARRQPTRSACCVDSLYDASACPCEKAPLISLARSNAISQVAIRLWEYALRNFLAGIPHGGRRDDMNMSLTFSDFLIEAR